MYCSRLLLALCFSTFSAVYLPVTLHAVEDFRSAIKSIVPHLVLVRRFDEERQEQLEKSSQVEANQKLLEALRSRTQSNNYQHAFRVADDMVATVDQGSRSSKHKWELLSRDGKWHDLELVGRDNISRLVILKSTAQLLDQIAASGPSVEGAAVGHWISGVLEMGLPTVVVWYEDGGPRAKATMIAATGSAMTRGLAILDFAFNRTHVGSPVLDAQGGLLGLVANPRRSEDERDLARRLETPQLEVQKAAEADSTASSTSDTKEPLAPKTIIITTDTLGEDEQTAEYIVPVDILNRLLSDVHSSQQPVFLDYGLIGIRLGNGDATIRGLIRGGAAEEAKCRPGDKIVAVDGKRVRTDGDIMTAIIARRAGDDVLLEIVSAPEATDTADGSDDPDSSNSNAETTSQETRTIQIKMRGIRTRNTDSGSGDVGDEGSDAKPEQPDNDRSSSINQRFEPAESRLVGVVEQQRIRLTEDFGSNQFTNNLNDSVRLQVEIESLLKELNQRKQE